MTKKVTRTKGASKGELVVAEPTLPAEWEQKLTEDAKETSARELSSGGNWISSRNGRFAFQGEVLREPLLVVVLDHAHDNAYYTGAFDPDSPRAPDCWAIHRNEQDLAPDDSVPHKQSSKCADCWANAFRSDARQKGKACKTTRRLLLVAFSELFESAPTFWFIRISVMGDKQFKQYLKKLKAMNRTTWSQVSILTNVEEGNYSRQNIERGEPFGESTAEVVRAFERIEELRRICGDDLLDVTSYRIRYDDAPANDGRRKKGTHDANTNARGTRAARAPAKVASRAKTSRASKF